MVKAPGKEKDYLAVVNEALRPGQAKQKAENQQVTKGDR